MEAARRVEPGDAATALTNFDQVDHGRAYDVAVAAGEPARARCGAAHFELVGLCRLAALHQRGFGGRAAHVERDDSLLAEHARETGRCHYACGGPGLDDVDRALHGLADSEQT